MIWTYSLTTSTQIVKITKSYCAVPENIHTPPTEGIGISWGVGGSVRPKNLKKCMKYNWNFLRGGGLRKKSLLWGRYGYFLELHILTNSFFMITAEIHAPSLANFYCQYVDSHMNLIFMWCVSEREPAIWQFVIVKNKLMSVFNASVLFLIMNFVITLSK